jgi:hypothetical protein
MFRQERDEVLRTPYNHGFPDQSKDPFLDEDTARKFSPFLGRIPLVPYSFRTGNLIESDAGWTQEGLFYPFSRQFRRRENAVSD